MSAYADIEIDQGEDFGLQVIWTDMVNESYKVCHPIRLQARSAAGQIIIDAFSVDQYDADPDSTQNMLTYSTEGGVVQVIIHNSVTSTLPVGDLYYDLFVSYQSTTTNFVTGSTDVAVRVARLIRGKMNVQGRVTKHL